MMNQDLSTQNGRREIYSLREIVVLALGAIYETSIGSQIILSGGRGKK
jgi:hypothetical protein